MRQKAFLVLMTIIFAAVPLGFIVAQDVTEEPLLDDTVVTEAPPMGDMDMTEVAPVTPGVSIETTIGEVTANSASFYGQQVHLEGTIDEMLNVRMLVLGEAALLGSNQILVINNTDTHFDLWVTRGQQMWVTGTIYPSINESRIDPVVVDDTGMLPTDEFGATPVGGDPFVAPMPPVIFAAPEYTFDFDMVPLPEEYFGHTILVIDSFDTIEYINPETTG